MLISLDLYSSIFEKKLLDKTCYFYQMQSRDLIKKYEIPDYLRFVLSIIQNEKAWTENYIDKRSLTDIIQSLEKVLIVDHYQAILERGFHEMVTAKPLMTDLIKLLFEFSQAINILDRLKTYWSAYIKE